MHPLTSSRTRLFALALGAGLAGALAVTSACLTDPPPDLPPASSLGPEIILESVVPKAGPLTQWPANSEFVVPVRNVDPNKCFFSVYMGGQFPYACRPCGGAVIDGVLLIEPNLPSAFLDPNICDQPITFYVATQFTNGSLCTAFDDGQGTITQWIFSPPSCLVYDAGAVQDGAFPVDAAPDGLPVVPESGVE